MLSRAKVSAPPRAPIYGCAAALCLLAPFVVFLTANDYRLLASEVFPFYLATLVAGLLVGLLVKLRLVVIARLALFACLFLAIAFLYDVQSPWSAVAVAALCGVAIGLLRDNAATVLVVAGGLHIVSTIGVAALRPNPISDDPIQSVASGSEELPPVLHLVLDEFIGLRGLPSELPSSTPLRSSLVDYYRARGFDLASHAYSQYTLTTNSLSSVFNFASGADTSAHLEGSGDAFSLASNRYFDHLLQLGYVLHVHQSSYLDFCSTPGISVASCSTYKNNSIAAIADVEISGAEKSRFILNSYLDSSAFLRDVRRSYLRIGQRLGIDLPPWQTGNSRVGALALSPTIAALEHALRNVKPGEFHFAHLMLPHYPYVHKADCAIKPKIRTWLNTTPFETADMHKSPNTSESRAERYSQYMAQITCANRIIDDLFDAVRASGQWERSIIVVHGDHGSRILRNRMIEENFARLTDDDYRDAFSTFFAAKKGTLGVKLISQPTPLQSLLGTVWGIPVTPTNVVYLTGEDGYFATPLRGFEPIPEVTLAQ